MMESIPKMIKTSYKELKIKHDYFSAKIVIIQKSFVKSPIDIC